MRTDELDDLPDAIRRSLEDREDYLEAIAVSERREPTITLEELRRRIGMEP